MRTSEGITRECKGNVGERSGLFRVSLCQSPRRDPCREVIESIWIQCPCAAGLFLFRCWGLTGHLAVFACEFLDSTTKFLSITAQLAGPNTHTSWRLGLARSFDRFIGLPVSLVDLPRARLVHVCTYARDTLGLYIRNHPYRFVPFASSPCGLQDLADLPRLALLLVSQADGQPSAEKLTEMKPEKRPKTDWAAKLELHFDACFQIPGQHLHYQVCDTIHIYPNVVLSGKGSRPEQIAFNHPGHHLVQWFGYPPSQSVYVILWFNDELLASTPPLSKCHRLVLVNRAGALVNAFWCSLSSRYGTLSCNGAKSNLGDRWCHGLVNGFW